MKKRKLNIETPEIIKEEPQIPPHIKALQSLEDLLKKGSLNEEIAEFLKVEFSSISFTLLRGFK